MSAAIINTHVLPTPTIVSANTQDNKLFLTIANVDVSVVNAFRRTILTDIPVICLRTETHEVNQVKVSVNTSRMHNEMLLHRISCVPIHSTDSEFCEKYQLELDVTNDAEDHTIMVTTEHFRLRRIIQLDPLELGDLVPPEESKKVFPPDQITRDFIDLVKLRPATGSIPGERVALVGRFQWHMGDSGERKPANSSFSNTVNMELVNSAWEKHEQTLLADAVDESAVAKQKQDFYLLDAKRTAYSVPNSFDFWVETYKIYSNQRLMELAGNVLRKKLRQMAIDVDSRVLPIYPSSETQMHGYLGVIESTMPNSWDVILLNEGDTIGNMLSYAILDMFHFREKDKEVLYCAHKKFHPDHNFGVLRIVIQDNNDPVGIRRILTKACEELNKVISLIKA